MGGFNSGRHRKKGLIRLDLESLDVRQLQRNGPLIPGMNAVTLAHGGKRYAVALEWTSCNYGGLRAWFRCPCCSRRAAIIYGGAGQFACRQCHKLGYPCQLESPADRAARRADAIRRRLGWEAGILRGTGGKPKGMRWRTYDRLTAEHDTFVQVALR